MYRILKKLREKKTLRILAHVSLTLFPLFCLFIMEYMNSGGVLQNLRHVRSFVLESTLSALFSSLVILLTFAVLLLLCRKAAVAAGILGFISLVFAYINYMKLATNGDNFFPADIGLIVSVGDLTAFVGGAVPRWFWVGVAAVILWVALLWFFRAEIPLTWKIRIPSAVCTVLAVVLLFSSPQRSELVFGKFNMSFFNAALQRSNYIGNGFLGAFIINAVSMNVARPANYSRETIEALLAGFEETPAEVELFDVIVVLSESFFDVRLLEGLEFSQNPLPNFDEVMARANTYGGLVYTTALYGGTIRPEFEILTGLTTDSLAPGLIPYGLIRQDLASYVSNYGDAGYRTIALHPFNERFYSRNEAYPLIGFDEFFGETEISDEFEPDRMRGYVTDVSLFHVMRRFLDNADGPMFMKAITIQGHQPYHPLSPDEIQIKVTSDLLTPDVLDSVTTFTQILYNADIMLGMLIDYIDERDRPTVLLFYGDHLPNLGNNHAAYLQTGMFDLDNLHFTEKRLWMFSTPFLIYSNRELRQGLLEAGADNHISTYYLLSVLAEMTGFHRTPYMNLILDHYSKTPFYNIQLRLPETEDSSSLATMQELIAYDRLIGGNYSAN